MYQNIFLPVQHLRKAPVNVPGICWLFFFRWEDVQVWPKIDPINGVINDQLVLQPNTILYAAQVTDTGRFLRETDKVGAGGPYVETQVAGRLVDDTTNNNLSIAAMRFHQFGLLVKERNGLIKLIGDQDSGADLEFDYNSGEGFNARKYNLQFSWESPGRIPIFLGGQVTVDGAPIPLPGVTNGAFSDDFSNDFDNG
jgi:hypothetical protein